MDRTLRRRLAMCTPRDLRGLTLCLLTAVWLLPLSPRAVHGAGTEQRFPAHRLIDELVSRGMTDLLEHLVLDSASSETAEALELVYRIHLSRWEDTTIDLAQRLEELEKGSAKIRELIQQFPDHESRPIWQTDLAGLLLFQTLDNAQVAGLFYEFGVATDHQAEVFEAAISEALPELFDASHRLFVLQGELPKQSDHMVKRVNTGKWARLIDQYAKLRTPFYTALACHFAALLPDDHPFFADLAAPQPKMPRRGATVEQERRRLREKGIIAVEEIVEDTRDLYGVRPAVLSATARLQLALGRVDEALAGFDTAEPLVTTETVAHLVLAAGRAQAHHAAGRTDEALAIVEALADGELAGHDVFALLLVTDLRHRLLLDVAAASPEAEQASALAAAYHVYDILFNDTRLAARAEDVRRYVYQRWAAAVEGQTDLAKLPSMMLRAAGKLTIDDAESLRGEALAAAPDDQGSLRARVLDRYQRAIRVYTVLHEREGLTDADRAEADYNRALAIYRQDESSDTHALDAVRVWLALATALPEQQVSSVAISNAADLMGELRQRNPDDAAIDALYGQVVTQLLEGFPQAPGASRRRVYHVEDVLLPAGRHDEALLLLQAVKPDTSGPDIYFAAQTNLLICRQQMLEVAPANDRAVRLTALRVDSQRVASEAEAALLQVAPGARTAVATALANALMAEAEVLLAEGKAEAAVERLRAIEAVDVPPNVRNVARSEMIVALAQLGELVKARQEAERLMATSPDDAAGVIYDVVTGMGRQVETMRREAAMPGTTNARQKALRDRSRSMAAGAVKLATLLVDWARQQPEFTEEDIGAVQLVSARAKSVAGMTGEAIAELEQIRQIEAFANDLDLLDAMGEACFQAGSPIATGAATVSALQRQRLIDAVGHYDTILGGMEPDNTGAYPQLWWNAWMRRLQINDILDEGTQDIPLRVRQLRMTNPELGGQPYKSELGRLENKHRLR